MRLGRLADQVAGDAALGDHRGERLEALPLGPPTRDQPDAAVERPDPGQRRGHVGRLRVVDVEHASPLADPLEAVADAREAPQPLGHGIARQTGGERGGGRRHRVLDVVGPEQLELVGPDQRLIGREDHSVAQADLAVRVRPPPHSAGQKRTRRAQPPRSRPRSSGVSPL